MRWYQYGDVRPDDPFQRHIRGGPDVQWSTYMDRSGPIPDARPDLGPCWTWGGKLSPAGYAYLSIDGRQVLADRWAYERFVGPIPAGLELDHLCRNRFCVNYERHLEPVTHQVNTLRGESPPARYALRNACSKGHKFTPDNTFIRRDKSRGCRTCDRARSRETHRKRRERLAGGEIN